VVEDLPTDVTLRVGERRTFRLPGQAQAGYRWRATVQSGADAVDVATSFDAAEPVDAVPGKPFAGEILSIAARVPGRARVRLAQARSWEPETAAIADHTLEITVVDRAS
jgi:predicted secreted protein